MKVVLDVAMSLNGMIARPDGSEDWLPYDGWPEFVEQAKLHNNIVMGRESYEKVTELYKNHNFDDVEVDHKLVVTSNSELKLPNQYTAVASPIEAIKYIKSNGIKTLYLIGGGVLNSEFMKLGLITNINVTIVPYVLGSGRPFFSDGDYESGLTMIRSSKLSNGRIRLEYKVNK